MPPVYGVYFHHSLNINNAVNENTRTRAVEVAATPCWPMPRIKYIISKIGKKWQWLIVSQRYVETKF